jgi:hypothetical protein
VIHAVVAAAHSSGELVASRETVPNEGLSVEELIDRER